MLALSSPLFTLILNLDAALAFLAAIAYFYSTKFELPEHYARLVEEYDRTLLETEDDSPFKLIPNLYEYEGKFTDIYLKWITNPDPNSQIHSEPILRSHFDIKFFSQRLLDLDQEHCQQQHQQDLDRLEQQDCPLTTEGLPPQQIQAQSTPWFVARQEDLKAKFEVDLNFINKEYEIVKQRCSNRIDTARQEYAEVQERWQQG